jgi:hypothetical protein
MPTLSGIVLALGMALRREAEQRAAVERAFVAQRGDLPYGTVPEKSTQRSVSVRNGPRSAVAPPSHAQLELPLGGAHQHIARLRTAGLAAMPTLAGVVMMLGMALRRGGAVS